MTADYLILIGGTVAAVVFIASLVFRRGDMATYHEPMPWMEEEYRNTTIKADFIQKDDAA